MVFGFTSLVASAQTPSISIRGREFFLNLPTQMQLAIQKLNPKFTAWNSGDYTQNVRNEVIESKDPRRAPFALILDVNHDGIPDLILDGHDDQAAILMCVYSADKAFKAIEIRRDALFQPKSVDNYYDGKLDPGIPYFIWPPNKKAAASNRYTFSIGYPQAIDKDGNEGCDPSILDFKFTRGKFIERSAQ